MTGGNLTGLFFAGARTPQPPELRPATFLYPNSTGYDGQFYRDMAHDPLLRKGYAKYLDEPGYRYRRILIPAIAAVLGAGSRRTVDFWCVAVTDIVLALGGVCFLELAAGLCAPWLAALLYLLLPATVASTDRIVTDGPAVAGFLAAWLLYRNRRIAALLAVLALLPLVRESAILVTAGVVLAFLRSGNVRRAALAALTVVPAAAWWGYVAVRAGITDPVRIFTIPVWPQVMRLFQIFPRPLPPAPRMAMQALDALGAACLLVALGWMGWVALRRWKDDTWLVLPSALLAACTGGWFVMSQPYDFLRVDSVLLAWTVLTMLAARRRYAVVYGIACSLPLLVYRAAPLLALAGWKITG